MASSSQHTILLMRLQRDEKRNTWQDYASPGAACDGLCLMFETMLKKTYPNTRKITYDIADLFSFIDEAPDMAALVLDQESHTYVPRSKKWIKAQVYKHLKTQVGPE
ncbi:hypothetical protein AAMO2058_000769500 [Amorphochlora amoebiformis]